MASRERPGTAARNGQAASAQASAADQPTLQPAPVLYTAAEAAAILRVKTSWLERQAAARKVPFTMLARSYRFTPAHIAVIVEIFEHAPSPDRAPSRISGHRAGSGAAAVVAGDRSLQPRPNRSRRLRGEPAA